ncbi:MAG: type III pantothenate kinase [Gammaproteobacteria bacterium]|nr:type III pantothenate kinase [Gammaproteobacteria bacterium]
MLLFDIGNSRIKWQKSHNFSESPNAFTYNREDLTSQLEVNFNECDKPAQDVVIVSVAGEVINLQIERWIKQRWGVGVRFLHSETQWGALHNGYENAEMLGADRWYALVGAVSNYAYPLVVCDIGSAVTIDIVDKTGTHLGGYITPGFEMMIRSLNSNTDINIRPEQFNGEIGLIPNNTNSAVGEGCLRAIASLIDSINMGVGANNAILTGGGAEKIISLVNSESIIDKNLIFYGIERVIEAP